MSDAHGKSLNLGRIPTTSIESQANLSPKWDQLIVMIDWRDRRRNPPFQPTRRHNKLVFNNKLQGDRKSEL
jgi:hypothetical protein